jgi:hypothetical protein
MSALEKHLPAAMLLIKSPFTHLYYDAQQSSSTQACNSVRREVLHNIDTEFDKP